MIYERGLLYKVINCADEVEELSPPPHPIKVNAHITGKIILYTRRFLSIYFNKL